MSGLLSQLAEWISSAVYSSGYVGVALLVAAGYLHLPAPTVLVLPLSGFLVGQEQFSFLPVLAATTVGGAVASVVWYLPGLWLGEERLRGFIERYGRYASVSISDFDKASDLFDRHGGKAVLIGHLIPGMTALISIPAGVKRMPIYGRFAVYTVLGTALWNGIFIVLGLVLGANYTLVEQYATYVKYGVLSALALGVAWFVWRRRRRRKK